MKLLGRSCSNHERRAGGDAAVMYGPGSLATKVEVEVRTNINLLGPHRWGISTVLLPAQTTLLTFTSIEFYIWLVPVNTIYGRKIISIVT